jgi:hypothetical protein
VLKGGKAARSGRLFRIRRIDERPSHTDQLLAMENKLLATVALQM